MQLLELTLPSPAENLALDEALLEACERGEIQDEVLRLWEPDHFFVVLGRSSDPSVEVRLATCRTERIPVLRRVSGGGTVVAGRGCLMYAVVLERGRETDLQGIDAVHRFVLTRIAECLAPYVAGVSMLGTSDLALLGDRLAPQKFSGNALRIKRSHLLYHGTILYDFNLQLLPRLLAAPTRAPKYRDDRGHDEFVTNLPLSRERIAAALAAGWNARDRLSDWPRERTAAIVLEKYTVDPRWVVPLHE